MFWTYENLRQLMVGRWLRRPADPADSIGGGVSTDSRAVQPGQVFFALRGEKFDGHDFLATAGAAGAAVLVVSDEAKAQSYLKAAAGKGGAVLLVGDTVTGLQMLAAGYRNHLQTEGVQVIAITGSCGKTTTRHLIHTVLSARWRGTQSPKSFNNHIGVPLTLLAADEKDDFVVVEIGTNHPGEIAALTQIARPDVAVLTVVGTAHIGMFGSRQAIAAEKTELFRHMHAGGLAVAPGDELVESQLGKLPDCVTVVRFGESQGCQVRLARCECSEGGMEFGVEAHAKFEILDSDEIRNPKSEKEQQGGVRRDVMKSPDSAGKTDGVMTFRLPMLGRHNAINALAAVAVGRWLGVSDQQMQEALAKVTAVSMRLEVRKIGTGAGGVVILNDAYNANPDSMGAAIKTLASYPLPAGQGRRVAIVGDMLELGDEGPEMHRQIGKQIAAEKGIDAAVFIGKLSMYGAEAARRVWAPEKIHAYPMWEDRLPEEIAGLVQGGDVALIKASRGMGLERLVPVIEKKSH